MYRLWWPVIWRTTTVGHYQQPCYRLANAQQSRPIVVLQRFQTAAAAARASQSNVTTGSSGVVGASGGISQSEVDQLLDAAVDIVNQQQQQPQEKQRPFLATRTACETVISLAEVVASNSSQSKVPTACSLTDDKRFQQLLPPLETNLASQLEPLAIVSCLKALSELGLPPSSFCVRNLENALTWMARSCSIRDLIMTFSFSLQRQVTETQKLLHEETIRTLERRWTEVKDGRLFTTLLLSAELFSPQFVAKMEDRIADVVEEMPPADMVVILSALCRKRRRNLPLLRALTFHLAKQRSSLDAKQVADVLFALNKLSFKEQDTLERISSAVETQLDPSGSTAVVRSILTSLGQLKLQSCSLLDRICDFYKTRLKEGKVMESKDASTLVLTLASLNYIPANSQELFDHMLATLKKEDYLGDVKSQVVWLDIVWSLLVLNKATADHLSSVLDSDFHTAILYSNEKPIHRIKLLNINAAASSLHKDYKGPLIDVKSDPSLHSLAPPRGVDKLKFRQLVLDSFSTLYPAPRFLASDVSTGGGWTADAVVVCDRQAKPLQVEEYFNRFGLLPTTTAIRDLPEGAHRLVLIVASFQDCLLGGGISGSTSLTLRLAEAAGYTPLLITYRDIEPAMKAVTRVQKLDSLVKIATGSRK